MFIRNVTLEQLGDALRAADPSGNLTFNRLDPKGRGFNMTLRVRDSKGRFHRRGYSGRRLTAACYHGHYAFMESLFDLEPEAVIRSAMATYDGQEQFYNTAGNAGYRNIGSQMTPLCYEDACDCAEEEEAVPA